MTFTLKPTHSRKFIKRTKLLKKMVVGTDTHSRECVKFYFLGESTSLSIVDNRFFGTLFHTTPFVCNKTPFRYEQLGLHVFSSTQYCLYGSLIRHISMSDDSILITTHNPLM